MTQRLLVLTPRFPYPLYGGDVLRIYRLCEALEEFDITLLSICQTREEMNAELPADSPFKSVHRVYLPRWKSWLSALAALAFGKPLQVAYYASNAFQARVRELQDSHDVILCHLIRTAPYATGFKGTRVLELTDYMPLTYARSNALKGKSLSLRRLVYKLEKTRIEEIQNRLAPTFDLMTFVSHIDSEMFRQSSGVDPKRIAVYSNGVSLDDRPFKAARTGSKIAFVGTLKAMPNADAVSHFIRDVLPMLLSANAGIRFKVAGAVPEKFVEAFRSHPQVEFTGPVPDLAGALEDCCVGVCPMRIGAGVQNKMLDYMALGLAAVTTSLGAEGLDGAPGVQFEVADGPEAFAKAVLALLEDAARRHELAGAARAAIAQTYSWRTRLAALPKGIEQAEENRESRMGAASA